MGLLNKKTVDDINAKGKKVLVRCDFNVPLKDGVITDENRITAALPTIKKLIADGAQVILCSHLGKVKNGPNEKESLAPVAKRLAELLNQDVVFAADDTVVGENAKKAVAAMKDGDVVLLQNTRFRPEETKNGEAFSKELASLCDIYVNDAFGAAHRTHSSTAKVAKLVKPAVSGLLMEKELRCLSQALDNPTRPFTAVVGGAKVSSKIGVLENLIDKVDNLIIGGGMAYTFVKANGGKIGCSICEDDQIEVAKAIEAKAAAKGVKLVMATDVLVTDDFSGNGTNKFVAINEIPDGFEGVDAGLESRKAFAEVLKSSKTILMNGPVGAFENPKFAEGTKAVLEAIVEATATENGMNEYWYCAGCDCFFTDAEGKYNIAYLSLTIPATGETPVNPETGDNAIFFVVALVAVSALGVAAVSFKKREN